MAPRFICNLEKPLTGIATPFEGKALLQAYLACKSEEEAFDTPPDNKIIQVDFIGKKKIEGDLPSKSIKGIRRISRYVNKNWPLEGGWYDPKKAGGEIQSTISEIKKHGIDLDTDSPFAGDADPSELIGQVCYDLECLLKILDMAEKQKIRFNLCFAT